MRCQGGRLRRGVLPVCAAGGVIGTATVVAPGLALTALHVIAPRNSEQLSLGGGHPITSVESLSLTEYGAATEHAYRSQWRAALLVGADTETPLGTVDLALLVAPGLPRRWAPPPRHCPVAVGECLVVPGYPGGHWSISQGPVTGTDGADFALRVLLGPGASGAPVLDAHNRLAGVVTLDHQSATICVGPHLLNTFLQRLLVPTGSAGP